MNQKHLESLDLNLILVLYWLLTERNVTVAANKLGLSQPATSRALGRIRLLYDDPILIKSGRSMLITPLGERLLPIVTRAVKNMRDVIKVSEPFDPLSYKGRFRIACKDHVGANIIKAWAKTIRHLAPGLDLDIVDLTMAAVADLTSGKLDLVICPLGQEVGFPAAVDIDRFVIKPIYTEGFKSCVRANHPLANQNIDLNQFCAMNHVLINPGGGDFGMIDAALEKMGRSRHISYRTQNFLLALPAVLKTDCVLTASASLLSIGIGGLHVFDCPVDATPLDFMGGWHPNWTHDSRHKWVRDHLIALLKDNSAGLA